MTVKQIKHSYSVVYVIKAPHHEDVWGNGRIPPRLLDFGTRWRWVVSLTLRSFYPLRKIPRYQLNRTMRGPKDRCAHAAKETNPYPGRPAWIIRVWCMLLSFEIPDSELDTNEGLTETKGHEDRDPVERRCPRLSCNSVAKLNHFTNYFL